MVKYVFFENNPLSLSRWQDVYYLLLPATHPHFDVLYNSPPAVYEVPTNASELESEQAIASDKEHNVHETPATNEKEKDIETHTTTKSVVQNRNTPNNQAGRHLPGKSNIS